MSVEDLLLSLSEAEYSCRTATASAQVSKYVHRDIISDKLSNSTVCGCRRSWSRVPVYSFFYKKRMEKKGLSSLRSVCDTWSTAARGIMRRMRTINSVRLLAFRFTGPRPLLSIISSILVWLNIHTKPPRHPSQLSRRSPSFSLSKNLPSSAPQAAHSPCLSALRRPLPHPQSSPPFPPRGGTNIQTWANVWTWF